jgi:hypothetical protein
LDTLGGIGYKIRVFDGNYARFGYTTSFAILFNNLGHCIIAFQVEAISVHKTLMDKIIIDLWELVLSMSLSQWGGSLL